MAAATRFQWLVGYGRVITQADSSSGSFQTALSDSLSFSLPIADILCFREVQPAVHPFLVSKDSRTIASHFVVPFPDNLRFKEFKIQPARPALPD